MGKSLDKIVDSASCGSAEGASAVFDPVGFLSKNVYDGDYRTLYSDVYEHLPAPKEKKEKVSRRVGEGLGALAGVGILGGLYVFNPLAAILPLAVTSIYSGSNLIKNVYSRYKERRENNAVREENSRERKSFYSAVREKASNAYGKIKDYASKVADSFKTTETKYVLKKKKGNWSFYCNRDLKGADKIAERLVASMPESERGEVRVFVK